MANAGCCARMAEMVVSKVLLLLCVAVAQQPLAPGADGKQQCRQRHHQIVLLFGLTDQAGITVDKQGCAGQHRQRHGGDHPQYARPHGPPPRQSHRDHQQPQRQHR